MAGPPQAGRPHTALPEGKKQGLTNFGNVYTGLSAFGWGSFWVPVSRSVFNGVGTGAGIIYQRPVNGAADSPIVKERGSADQWMGGIGLGYSW